MWYSWLEYFVMFSTLYISFPYFLACKVFPWEIVLRSSFVHKLLFSWCFQNSIVLEICNLIITCLDIVFCCCCCCSCFPLRLLSFINLDTHLASNIRKFSDIVHLSMLSVLFSLFSYWDAIIYILILCWCFIHSFSFSSLISSLIG